MKKLPAPTQNDVRHLMNLSNNDNLTTVNPLLRSNQAALRTQYTCYEQSFGNAWGLRSNFFGTPLKDVLIYCYENRQNDELKFITNMRDTHDEICSMCGSKFPWSIDHVLPKSDFPDWAFFSKNLVPACKCNIRRGQELKGSVQSQARIIHPYYDDIFGERQISCLITSANDYRWVNVQVVFLNHTHPDIESIKFHVEKIVKRSGLEKFIARTQWSKIVNKPSLAIRSLYEKGELTLPEVTSLIEKDLRWFDERTGTKNNWDSIFLHGLLNSPGALRFVTDKHNDYVRHPNLEL